MKTFARVLAAAVWCALLVASHAAEGQTSLTINRMHFAAAAGSSVENCTGLRDLLASITGATAGSPHLVKLEPGIYDCGLQILRMKPWVSIEGSGSATVIRGSGGAGLGRVELASNTELRSLRVETYGAGLSLAAVSAFFAPVVNARLFDVQAVALTTDGQALVVSSPFGSVSEVTVSRSRLEGADMGVSTTPGGRATLDYSIVIGGVGGGGTETCRVCTNATTLLDASCQPSP